MSTVQSESGNVHAFNSILIELHIHFLLKCGAPHQSFSEDIMQFPTNSTVLLKNLEARTPYAVDSAGRRARAIRTSERQIGHSSSSSRRGEMGHVHHRSVKSKRAIYMIILQSLKANGFPF
ncbi:hypothetical protein CEXT_309231 [Caerostris extrusa]|uniref:Uncharacterized protein n=1 Tax=Caerostris extrusa TaxID=172846 RepID=A0AAV4XVQ9_CAEEX|nr:hypothetical protein CEXT_309231 [Caerostris extrusa]